MGYRTVRPGLFVRLFRGDERNPTNPFDPLPYAVLSPMRNAAR